MDAKLSWASRNTPVVRMSWGMVYRRRVFLSAKAGTIKWIFSELLTKKHNAICYIHIGKMSHKNIIDESIILLNWEIEKATFPLFTDY